MDTELQQVCARLVEIFQDRSRYKLLLGYRDLEAQAVLNLLQNLLDSPRVKDPKLKNELVVAVQRLSKKSALYPECFVLKNISIEKNSDGSIHALSSGKFGDVWRGSMGGRNVCLKVMRVYRNSKIHELLKAFSCEAVVWSQLQHANILPFYGIYRLEHPSHDRICLVSPWMTNGNIDEFLADEPNADRVALATDIANGLKYLHANNVVHGDLKGANVLVNSSKKACLADFGLSTIRDPEVLALTTTNSSTSCGGTIRWMAPELLNPPETDEPLNTKESDIYAFAGVSYEIFTGHIPFYEVFRDQTVIVKVNRGERPSRPDQATSTKYGLTESIWKLMQDCWLTDPDSRPAAAGIATRLASTPTQRRQSFLSPVSFRAFFAQGTNLESQLQRKELLRLLDISTEPLLEGLSLDYKG
ncbi:kinase-like protein [Macrolepiota fuliginosa MF-IS2]|uniref:Kinase-like protein n=1 Tax=Macrolepiota fuliginosa MF-IS2 TaxID=1400762 RepID=A0A9P5X7T5_9AGAR|nr:kinase-like protein [Macrolepiota fuliginosa MF-IS2]